MFRRTALILGLICFTTTVIAQRDASTAPRIEVAQTIYAADPDDFSGFGSALAVGSPDDDLPLYVTIPNPDSLGHVERFVNTGSGWSADGCSLVPPTNNSGSLFGASIATAGSGADALVIVGEPKYDYDIGPVQVNQGRVTVFAPDGAGCMTQIAVINPPTNGANQLFGTSVGVDVNGDEVVAVIGAPNANSSVPGAAYIFTSANGGATWLFQTALAAAPSDNGMKFGASVAIDGLETTPVAVVGAPNNAGGRVFAFRRNGILWPQDGVITPISADGDFGYAVDVDILGADTFVAAGCPGCGTLGRVEIFRRDDAPVVSYEQDGFISGTFGSFGLDVDVEQANGSVWLTLATGSFFANAYERIDNGGIVWQNRNTFLSGTLSSAALAIPDGAEPYVIAGDPNAYLEPLEVVGRVWVTQPEADPLQMLENGDFTDAFADPSLQPWKQAGKSSDKLKCDGIDGCYFFFKGSATENSALSQKVDLSRFKLAAGDVFTLSADVKTSVASPKLKLGIKVKLADGSTVKQNLKVTAAPDWTTFTVPAADTGLSTATAITVTITHTGKSGKLLLDNVTLLGADVAPRSPALTAPVLPPPPAR